VPLRIEPHERQSAASARSGDAIADRALRQARFLIAELAGRIVAAFDVRPQEAGELDRFITFGACVIDLQQHTMTIVNAGHIAPLIYRKATGQFEQGTTSDQTGLPLGIIEGNTFGACQVELRPGDSLILYTDGVTDAMSVDNRPFTTEAVRAAILSESGLAAGPHRPDHIGKSVLDAVRRHAAGRAQVDDTARVGYGRLDAHGSMTTAATQEHGPAAGSPPAA